MPAVEHVVIAAAGLGSRLGMGKPKCLVEIDARPILEYQLALLAEIPDVRVVVGFEEHQIIDLIQELRRDVIVVRNPAYRTTTTLQSYTLGAAGLETPCLFMDGDLLIEPRSFNKFLVACAGTCPLIAVTESKTDDAVYCRVDQDDCVVEFSRERISNVEWANVAWLPPGCVVDKPTSVFERLNHFLPLQSRGIVSFEVDTTDDLARAVSHRHARSISTKSFK